MNYYDYNSITSTANTLEGVAVWTIVSLILAIIGGVLVYFLFIKNKHLKILRNSFNVLMHIKLFSFSSY